ncbi:hypothetical protein C8T65DRAFT_530078, partial [Cerioporus squamosus]
KPSLEQINHFLRPLVDELLEFWHGGVYYSRTMKFPDGRLVRCVLIPLVCDLPAARQTAGFGHYSAKYFCHMCNLLKEDMNELDMSKWGGRTCEEHRAAAEAWKNLPSVSRREAAFKQNSTRWSVLLDLPYWDPIRFTVIDSMHGHYLGLLKHHCRNIWGMNVEAEDDEEDGPGPSEEDVAVALDLFYTGTAEDLSTCTRAKTLRHIHAHLRDTELPSWVDPVPTNVGTKARGKLSADQWHILCVVHLPIILVPLWYRKSEQHRERLDNFMDLVTEVVIGGLLEMSESAIRLYEEVSMRYLKTAKKLYDINITPNQHNSLHIPFFLRLFGPLHSIRTFFAERRNFDLQGENTSMKFG